MRIFYDSEFDENGETIELISIAFVREDGKEYYAVVEDADWDRINANTWLQDNVIPHLPSKDSGHWKKRDVIAQEIIKFVGYSPEFWGATCAYDWVALMQLVWGKMVDQDPRFGWPWVSMDVNTYKRYLDIKQPLATYNPKPHDALADALEIRDKWTQLRQIEQSRMAR